MDPVDLRRLSAADLTDLVRQLRTANDQLLGSAATISQLSITVQEALDMMIDDTELFYDGKSVMGWVLTVGGAVSSFVGILVNLQVYFRPTSLYSTIVMLVLLAGGIGLVARSLRPYAD